MSNQSEYYYGQGKVFLAPIIDDHQWRWVGDVSSLKINFEFEEQYSKRSIGGRLVNGKRFITFTGGNVTATWFDRSLENLELLLRGKSVSHQQGWTEEEFRNIKSGMTIYLQHQNIRDVFIENLNENIDYIVDCKAGSIIFITKPKSQRLLVEYDYSGLSGISILNNEPNDFSLRYEGKNIIDDKPINIELYRLSLDPIEFISLIDDKSEFSNVETTLQLLPDLSKNPKSDFGLFGRIIQFNDFNDILYDDEIAYDERYQFAY
ncbi:MULTISPECIES: hypothetical protein [unclassified Gilliamella]|uniref:phage tail tube protein n=1 Tax=unclassified Gilliamella TaxID=2685620 RepID=UPI001306A49E|nr:MULTISPECIES: hypothetical protein [unclassified Gilliamella]MWP48809.1 hypothetical protein [Gilliamella sp. Lep-s35]MWP68847.1 hypothetical protein [Gilliamella sp. Lep-s5]MWP77080.1 hypothetical protein [Gilliamella sp. Lep-s21]